MIALAITLVTIRTLRNRPAVPVPPQSSASRTFPRYYVALEKVNNDVPATKLRNEIVPSGTMPVYVSASEVIGYSFVMPGGDTSPLTIHKFLASDGTIRQLGTGTIPAPGVVW